MFAPGDVVHFISDIAEKPKFHVCVSVDGHYFFLNTPRKQFAGDFVFPCSDAPFMTPTESGNSVIACNMLIRMTEADLKRQHAKRKGSLPPELMRRLLVHVENSIVLAPVHKDEVVKGLGDYY